MFLGNRLNLQPGAGIQGRRANSKDAVSLEKCRLCVLIPEYLAR
jgi:hypothetical protein